MKNSTFSAQVANNLLTLLQGYSKTIRLLLVMLLTLTVTTNAWGETVTFTPSNCTNWTSSQVEQSQTIDGITLHSTKAANTSSQLRLYADNTHTITSTVGNITSVVFTCTANGTSNYGPGKMSGDGYVASTGKTGEWTGSATKVVLTGGQSRCTSILVTYTPSSGGGSDPEPTTQYTVKWYTALGTSTDVTLDEGAAITKPATDPTMSGYEFMGWTDQCSVAEDGAGFTPISNFGTADSDKEFYAVFAVATTTGGGGSATETTAKVTVKDYASANSWANGTKYTSLKVDANITASVTGSSNTGKYYTSGNEWRLYQTESPTLTITAADGYTIKTAKVTYNINNTGVLKLNGANVTSGTASTINASSVTYNVGNTSSATNGQVKVTAIEVVYTSGSASITTYSNYTTTCSGSTPVETYTVTFNANGHGTAPAAQTITSGETASEPTEPKETGYTFGGWYSNQQCTGDQFDFSTPIIADITLYAKWTIATYTIKATLDHCTSTPKIPDTYEFTGEEINLSYTITPETGYGLPRTITFSGPTYTWDQSTGILTLTGVIKSDVTFTIAAKKIHTITWKVDGEEYTTGDPSTTVLNNEPVSKLPTNPTLDCSGKTFVGWSDQEVSDGNKPSVLFTSAETSPQVLKNTIFHAVFATLTGSGNGQNTTDVLTHGINGKNSGNTNYTAFTEKKYNSDAIYAGNTANSHGGVQLRGSDGSGIVTTTSGGYAKSITIEWNSNTTDGRILDIYGKNEVYSAASDLYNNDGKGTKLGSITCGTSTKLTIDGDYQYIGLRSNSNAIYLNSISIVWSSSAAPTYTGYTTTCTFTAPELDPPTNLTVTDLTCSSVTLSWEEVENATGYEVVRTLGSNTTYNTTETSITIDNLDGGKENSWKVRAIGDGINYNNSDYTPGDNFTTLFSVKYYVDGVIWHGCANGCVANGSDFTICEETPTKANNTFTGWATSAGGEVEYQAGETINNIAANVTLHAVWSAVTYTVNWSVNGEDNPVTYTHGQDLALPSIDIEPCDGMDHVGWTDELGYRHGTDILFTEASGTVTSDATYYAVFATETSSDEGTETILDFSQKGYTNQQAISSATEGDITATFDKGTNANSNAPKYYTTGTAIRAYGGNTITVSSENTIFNVVITFSTGDDGNAITASNGSYTDGINTNGTYSNGTWNGSAKSITFTIGGTSGHRRIKSIAVTSTGNASYYTDHTTTCEGRQLDTPTNLNSADITHNSATLTWDEVAGARSYKVVINGTEYNTNNNSYTARSLKQKTAYTWTVQAIGNGTTFIDSEISAEATFTTEVAVTITWIAGATKTTNPIIYGQSIGEALGELPTPETPAGCKGKAFMGWSTTRNIASDGSDFDPITEDIVPTENTTYYAVFAQGDIAGAANITDELTHTINGKESTNTTYVDFSNKSYTSNAVYAGNSCNGTSDARGVIQLRSNNSTSGIITTASGGSIKSITVEWNSYTADGRTLDIYGKTTAYSAASDLYDDTKKGAILGSIVKGTSTSLTIDDNYQYIGLRSKSGAMYLTSITIVWQSGEVTYTDYSTSCGDFLVTYYGFNTGGYTTICGDNPGEITVPQFTTYTIPTCTPTEDPQGLNRTFAGTWVDDKGNSYKPGDSFEVTDDITLYAQWTWNTNTIPTDESGIADLATTDVVVTGGNTLTLAEGTTTINSLTLKGGLQSNGAYAMPVINIPAGATLVRNSNKINLDLTVNNQSYYPFAVPFEVQNIKANIHYLDETLNSAATYGKHYQVLTYDGALRAENGVHDDNWVEVGRHTAQKPSYLVPGKGYAISAVPAKGETTTTIRISMDVDDGWFAGGEKASITVDETTTTRNQIAVEAHAGAAATEHQRHAGWNFVANPYLSNFIGGGIDATNGLDYIDGKLIIQGSYEYSKETVPYVTIPAYNFAYYSQYKLSEAPLSPAYSFFVQVGESGTMTFETAGRQQAPASIAARNAEERPVKMDVDITLSDNHSSDQTGIIISDRYSDAYEIGRDLEKLFGSAYNLSVYTLMADNTPLAFQALAIRSNMQVIPVGYRTPAQGEYTFRLNEATSSIDLLNEQYEQLVLVDYQTGELTNLLIADYTFYSERTQADNRFAIYAVPRQNAPTDLPNAIGQDKEAQKIIHNGHLYILRDGNVYNGNGQIVK